MTNTLLIIRIVVVVLSILINSRYNLTQTLLIINIIIIMIVFSINGGRKEGWGVFSHRGTLHGIKNQVRNHYTLQELDYQNPSDYWSKTHNLSVYDKDIQQYHSKRFDPESTN